jgi:hypothetical protein
VGLLDVDVKAAHIVVKSIVTRIIKVLCYMQWFQRYTKVHVGRQH